MAMTLSEYFERELAGGIVTEVSHKQKKDIQSSHERSGVKRSRQYVCMSREVYAMMQDVLQQKPLHHEVLNPVLQDYLDTQWKLRKQSADMLEEREKRVCGCVQTVMMISLFHS